MIPGEKQIVDGNEQVIKLFEYWLERAKKEDIDHATITICRGPHDADRGYAGAGGREAIACFALDYLKFQIMGDFTNRMNPPTNADVTADKWVYNLGRNPASYDFIAWLVNAEMTREREHAPFPLKVAFYVGKDGHLRDGLQSDYQMQAFVNIIRPALAFVGAIESAQAQNGRVRECFSYGPAVEGWHRSEKVPMLRAPESASALVKREVLGLVGSGDRKKAVVITLRECDRQPHRNSNVHEWVKFARHLRAEGERVVFVRDTAKANEPLEDFETCPIASMDIHARLALYEQSKCNLFVSNGPASLAFFSECPWLMFSALDPTDSYFPNTPDGWRTFTGIGPGEQFPWSRPDQRIIWATDTFENMRTAWEDLQDRQAAA